jgi:hypothetical protein
MSTITTMVLRKLPNEDRTLEQRIADHIDGLHNKGVKEEASKRIQDGSLIKYEEEIKD